MKLGKDIALVLLGAASVKAYQKYNKPIRRKLEKAFDRTNDKLENMM